MTAPATTLADLADRHLRRDIVSGALKPGEKLSIALLIKRYAIGATPLREALSRLSTDHLVVLEGKRGFSVAPVSAAEMDDISLCRRLIETEAVRLAVQHGDEAWESRVVAAFHRLDRAEERVRQGAAAHSDEWEEHNREFHKAVVSACGSAWLVRLQEMLYVQHERYRRLSLQHRDPARDLQAEHRAIMQACLDRDAMAAARLSGEHIDRTAAAVHAVLAATGKPALRRRRSATQETVAQPR